MGEYPSIEPLESPQAWVFWAQREIDRLRAKIAALEAERDTRGRLLADALKKIERLNEEIRSRGQGRPT